VTAIGAILFVSVCLGIQALCSGLFPGSDRYVDFLVLPVIWFAVQRSQRSGMLTGAAAGLAQDAWFRSVIFGMSGFEKTFLGWFLGALSSRFDLQAPVSLFLAGALFTVAQDLLGKGLELLLLPGQQVQPPDYRMWAVQAAVNGLLVIPAFRIVNRVAGKHGLS